MWQIMWAHPEFGQVLATCSFDNTAATWEEQSKKPNDYLSRKEYKDSLWANKALWLNKNCKYKFGNFLERLD